MCAESTGTPEVVTVRSEPGVAGSGRIAFWDNARFLAVTLVVAGHAIQPLVDRSGGALTLYLVIYAFHMPAFAIISGYFSSAEPPTARHMLRVLTDLVIPYVIMEAAWSIVKLVADGESGFDPTTPSWTLWFLVSLAIFRLVLPYLALLRWPLAISLVLSVGVGYLNGVDSTFALARTFGFLPFFVLGWKLSTTDIAQWWRGLGEAAWWIRGVAAAIFAGAAWVVSANLPTWRTVDLRHWLYYDQSYSDLGTDSVLGGAGRLALLAVAVILCAAFLALVPRHPILVTELGTGTMYVYLLHSFALYPIRETGLLDAQRPTSALLMLLCVASVAVALVLASPPCRRLFRPVIQPDVRWLLTRARPAKGRGADHDEPSLPSVSSRVDLATRGS